MSIHDTPNTNESTETETRGPRNGIAQALLEADPDTPIEELPKLLEDVEHWVCTSCGRKNFVRPTHCGECGTETFEQVVPSQRGENDGR